MSLSLSLPLQLPRNSQDLHELGLARVHAMQGRFNGEDGLTRSLHCLHMR
jgi:hypothetical protein